jgi:chemotaxis protein MotB
MKKDVRPIVIVKKIKKGGHGHHGGSWKVAYADFVTAMMAFFMVMWLVGLDDSTRRHIEQYFSHPVGFHQGAGSGDSPIAAGASPSSAGDSRFAFISRVQERRLMDEVAESIQDEFQQMGNGLDALRVEVVVGDDGLRIELLESGGGETYFARGSSQPQTAAVNAITMIGRELSALTNPIIIEGHTDALPYARSANYTNWELSADRANVARRTLQEAGVEPFRIREVRALGASRPRNQDDPAAAENRRISIILPFSTPLPVGDPTVAPGTENLPPGATTGPASGPVS